MDFTSVLDAFEEKTVELIIKFNYEDQSIKQHFNTLNLLSKQYGKSLFQI